MVASRRPACPGALKERCRPLEITKISFSLGALLRGNSWQHRLHRVVDRAEIVVCDTLQDDSPIGAFALRGQILIAAYFHPVFVCLRTLRWLFESCSLLVLFAKSRLLNGKNKLFHRLSQELLIANPGNFTFLDPRVKRKKPCLVAILRFYQLCDPVLLSTLQLVAKILLLHQMLLILCKVLCDYRLDFL